MKQIFIKEWPKNLHTKIKGIKMIINEDTMKGWICKTTINRSLPEHECLTVNAINTPMDQFIESLRRLRHLIMILKKIILWNPS